MTFVALPQGRGEGETGRFLRCRGRQISSESLMERKFPGAGGAILGADLIPGTIHGALACHVQPDPGREPQRPFGKRRLPHDLCRPLPADGCLDDALSGHVASPLLSGCSGEGPT
jgi:hypothetical protein